MPAVQFRGKARVLDFLMSESGLQDGKLGNGRASRREEVQHAAEILRQSAAEVQLNSRTTSQQPDHAAATNQVHQIGENAGRVMQQGFVVAANAQRQFAEAGQFCVEFQQRFMRDYTVALLQGTAIMLRTSRGVADQWLVPVELQIEQRKQAGEKNETKHVA